MLIRYHYHNIVFVDYIHLFRANVLKSTYMFLSHCRHHTHHQILSLCKSVVNLHQNKTIGFIHTQFYIILHFLIYYWSDVIIFYLLYSFLDQWCAIHAWRVVCSFIMYSFPPSHNIWIIISNREFHHLKQIVKMTTMPYNNTLRIYDRIPFSSINIKFIFGKFRSDICFISTRPVYIW